MREQEQPPRQLVLYETMKVFFFFFKKIFYIPEGHVHQEGQLLHLNQAPPETIHKLTVVYIL